MGPTVAMRWKFGSAANAASENADLLYTIFDFMSGLVNLAINLLLQLISADRRNELCGLWAVHCSGVREGGTGGRCIHDQ